MTNSIANLNNAFSVWDCDETTISRHVEIGDKQFSNGQLAASVYWLDDSKFKVEIFNNGEKKISLIFSPEMWARIFEIAQFLVDHNHINPIQVSNERFIEMGLMPSQKETINDAPNNDQSWFEDEESDLTNNPTDSSYDADSSSCSSWDEPMSPNTFNNRMQMLYNKKDV